MTTDDIVAIVNRVRGSVLNFSNNPNKQRTDLRSVSPSKVSENEKWRLLQNARAENTQPVKFFPK